MSSPCGKNQSKHECAALAAKVLVPFRTHSALLTYPSHYPAADRRPIDPPPIVQLRVIDHASRDREREGSSRGSSPGRFIPHLSPLNFLPHSECALNLVWSDLTRIVFAACHIFELISLLLSQIDCRDLCLGSLNAPRACPRSSSLLPITRC